MSAPLHGFGPVKPASKTPWVISVMVTVWPVPPGAANAAAGAGHDQLRHVHRHRQPEGANRPARQGQAKCATAQHGVRLLGELLQMGRRSRGLTPPMRSIGIKIAAEGATDSRWRAPYPRPSVSR